MVGGWLVALIGIISGAVLVPVCRWIVRSNGALWSRHYPRYGREVDQRWAIPIAMSVDLIFAAVGLATRGDAAFWISMAVVVGVQATAIAVVLAWVRVCTNRAGN